MSIKVFKTNHTKDTLKEGFVVGVKGILTISEILKKTLKPYLLKIAFC
jgi:hypothetical protein